MMARRVEGQKKLWPGVADDMLWNPKSRAGYIAAPRLMPLMMSILDDLSGKGFYYYDKTNINDPKIAAVLYD